MREHQQSTGSPVGSGYVAVGLLVVALVGIAHPIGVAFGLLAGGAVALFGRTVWRQATTRGLSIPGVGGTLRVETTTGRDERGQWAMTVSISER